MAELKKQNPVYVILGFLLCFNVVAWIWVWDLNKPRFLEVIFFDVGQGDAIFIETPTGQQILIDGGPSSVILEKLGQEMPFYDRVIDLVILTHPEHDHLFGLLEVLKRYKVKNILWTGIRRETNEWQEWIRLLKDEGANIMVAEAGQRIILGQEPVIFMSILYPFESLEGQEFKRANNTSITAQLVFNDFEILFTGDISKKIELKLKENYQGLQSDILKVAHHGSKTSSSADFIKAVFPDKAVISSAKDNQYGHPHSEVLTTLEQFDIEILRTDEIGDIKIISNGNNWKIESS